MDNFNTQLNDRKLNDESFDGIPRTTWISGSPEEKYHLGARFSLHFPDFIFRLNPELALFENKCVTITKLISKNNNYYVKTAEFNDIEFPITTLDPIKNNQDSHRGEEL